MRAPAYSNLGQVYKVNPRETECFSLRLLLDDVTDPLSFQDTRKVNGQWLARRRQSLGRYAGLYSNTNSSTFRYSIDYMFPVSSRHVVG